jgi:hypothetical protein
MALFDGIRDFFNPDYVTEEERANQLQAQSDDLWGQVMGDQPSVEELMGLDPFFSPQYLGMPPRPGGAGKPGTQMTQAQAQARAEWDAEYARRVQEAQADPYHGLELLGESEMAGAGADPASIEAQRRALGQMQGIYDAGGYTDSERAQLQMAQRDAAMGERSQRLAAMESARARGMGGSGMDLMGALAAQQGGANRASDYANQIAIAGQQRALQALQQSGDWAGRMRDQSFSEDSARRAQADAFNMVNVGMMNDWTRARGDAVQTAYGNQMAATAGATGQYNQSAAINREDSAADRAQTQQIMQGVITGIGAAVGGPAGAQVGSAVGGAVGRQQTPSNGFELPSYPTGYTTKNTGRTY